jgi:hypothetical protein
MDFAFYFWLYQDEALAIRLAKQIRQFHPDTEVIAIYDGPCNEEAIAPLEELGVQVHDTRQRLKLAEYGGAFLSRNYDLLLRASDACVFIKLDPDSSVNNTVVPMRHQWFGQPMLIGHEKLGIFPATWGCGMGLTRGAIAQLLSSEQLNDPQYQGIANVKTGILTEDIVLGHALTCRGFSPVIWSQVYLAGRWFEGIPTQHFAITHPCKDKEYVHP